MADYTPVTSQQKLPPQMSLGDMVNMANAVQSYQQAQQLNPLQLEMYQNQLSKAKSLLPYELSTAASGAAKSGIEANVAAQTADPKIAQAGSQADTAATEAIRAKYGLTSQYQDDFTKILGGYANDPRLSPEALTKNKTNAVDVLHEIKAQAVAKGIPAQNLDMITAPAMTIAMQNPEAFPAHLKNMINMGLSASEKRASQLETTEVSPSGQVIRKTAPGLYGQQQQVSIEQPGGNAPMPQIVEVNGVKYSVSAPKTPGGQPIYTPVGQQTTAPAAAPATQPAVAPVVTPKSQADQKAKATASQQTTAAPAVAPTGRTEPIPAPQGIQREMLVKQDMPVQTGAGVIPQMNSQQDARYEVGQKIFSDAADASKTAADQGVVLNTIKQNIAQAQSSRPGQLLRQGGKYLKGNENLDTLVKSLAQNQILQAKLMGVDSVNAERTSALANGSEDIDPKALQKIVEQTEATKTAAQMYNQGASAYKNRDPYNSAIHADNFQQAWKNNYDPRIFMVENINNSNMSADQKTKEIAKIKGIATPAELKGLQQKAYNIRRLQMGDF